ncbi:MAG: 1-acyl-sn-glycerol-3-phosphate acyltransferase [Cyanothece sp. SIO1E1]|nr:1-acyl-sn-glycerol-3-phosphate acyltransferase [Cyanothece sp. SIO1E1]
MISVQKANTSRFSPWLTPLAYFLGNHLVLPLYFGQIKVVGREHLPSSGPVILAPTHRARWDALVVPYAVGREVTGRDVRFMVTSTEVQGLQGCLIRRLGGFAVNTQSPQVSSLRHGIDLLKNGEMMVIFPEGGIFRDARVHTLKPGLARLALQAESSQLNLGVKLLPISIQYDQPYPQWTGNVTVKIGSPLLVSEYSSGALKHRAQKLTADLKTALLQLSGEVTTEVKGETMPAFASSN